MISKENRIHHVLNMIFTMLISRMWETKLTPSMKYNNQESRIMVDVTGHLDLNSHRNKSEM